MSLQYIEGTTMDITKVIETFKNGEDEPSSTVFGRICTTNSRTIPPAYLSDARNRKTVFLFGADTVKKAAEKKPFELLVHLGLLPEYIHLKACLQQASYWLVLLKQHSDGCSSVHSTPPIVPATWDGLKAFVSRYYPLAEDEIAEHWTALRTTPIEDFEADAGFKFIKALEPGADDRVKFMSYSRFCELQRPVKAWQVRCFLYCELRIFELFKGDGYTYGQNGCKGEREFIAPNFKLSDQKKGNVAIIPLNLHIPDDVHYSADHCNLRKK